MVADALSQKVKIAHLMVKKMSLLQTASKWKPDVARRTVWFGNISLCPTLLSRIKEAQKRDGTLQKRRDKAMKDELPGYTIGPDGILRYQDRVFLSYDMMIKNEVLDEAYCSRYTVHPKNNKMYQYLK